MNFIESCKNYVMSLHTMLDFHFTLTGNGSA